MLEGECT